MGNSIRWRLVASYVLLTLLTVAVVGLLALSLVRHSVARQEEYYLRANAEAVARRADALLMQPMALRQLVHTASFLTGARVRVLTVDEQVLVDSGQQEQAAPVIWLLPPDGVLIAGAEFPMSPPIFAAPLPEGALPELVAHEAGVIAQARRVQGAWGEPDTFAFDVMVPGVESQPALTVPAPPIREDVRAVRVPMGEQPIGYVEFQGAPDFGEEALATTRQAFGLAAAGASLLAAMLGLVVSSRLTAPLHNLTVATGRMSQGDLSARAPVLGQDEIARLATQFNQMAARLESSFAELATERDTLRRFIADASHELRTPVTALKTFNELLQGAAAGDPQAQQEFLAESKAQLRRLEWITHNLLDLTRLEGGLVRLELQPHEATDLLTSATAPFRPLAQEQGVTLTLELPRPTFLLTADRTRLEMALSNLLDNALKFTPKGGTVMLGAAQRSSGVALWVRDSGPGIPMEEQGHIFDRFYRAPANRHTGSGLGLAIVQSIVHAHHGQISVQSLPGEGSQFTITLPERTGAAVGRLAG